LPAIFRFGKLPAGPMTARSFDSDPTRNVRVEGTTEAGGEFGYGARVAR